MPIRHLTRKAGYELDVPVFTCELETLNLARSNHKMQDVQSLDHLQEIY